MQTPAAAPAAGDKLDAAVLKIASVVVLGVIMSILDVTVVSVALPTFQEVFGASYATVAWTMTGYTLALATVIPLTGWAADRFGTKRLYILALVLFVLGSVLCSLAWDIGSLITFRVLQGLGGGMLMPLGMTIMTRAAGPDRIGRVMAVLGIPMLMGPIGGPILGGWMLESLSWHWIFLINVPIGAVALVAAVLVLPKDNPSPSETFDYVGMLLLSPGLALLLFGVSSIPEKGTVASSRVLVPALIGVALVVGFVFHALRPRHPLIDLRLFKNKQLTVATITLFLFAVAFFGAMLLVPSYFLQVRQETTLSAGLLLAPQGLGAMLSMPIAGKLADKTGVGKIVLFGMGVIAVGMGVLTQIDANTSYVVLLGVLALMGIGMGAAMMPLMTAALQTLNDHTIARGSTLMNIVQQVAASVGTAVMSVVLTNQINGSEAIGRLATKSFEPQEAPALAAQAQADTASGFAIAFTVAFVLLLLTLVPAFLLPRRKVETPEGAEAPKPVIMH
ncbi:Multidrug resistance protein B [Actinokineospora spheciospongiae]|uniref:Multidrug resistance protein B n=1 Tax=Actinokineospora spheciospongiae TaxID=909613 RepID=W7IPH3_9PSEU|nr:DHA2 family efflux MFS transporter permease subunit [Actinokineospora spheciospongiae]EWC58617.1 Multidrug resistance protein B [Actinokineospora spheciospongiae]PWW50223.1 EmrB/QacA subfamily drug resistance transporter [Actinokineospora spheciospongiae]